MPDDPKPSATGGDPKDQPAGGEPGNQPGNEPASQPGNQPDPDAQLLEGARDPDAVRNALKREREARAAAQRERDDLQNKVKEFEDRDKSESQRLEERATKAEGERESLAQENLRLRVAIEKKLPAELIDRLKGGSKEEMESDADELLKLVKSSGPATGFDGGARDAVPEKGDMNSWLRQRLSPGRQ